MQLAGSRHVLAVLALSVLLASVTTACGDEPADAGSDAPPTDASTASAGPRANKDHWHASFDVYACGEFLGPFGDDGPDVNGIHSHGDGLVHIHPWEDSAAGESATISLFADQVGIVVEDGTMTIPEPYDPNDLQFDEDPADEPIGTTWTDGDACPTGPGRVALFVWPTDAAGDAAPSEVVTTDIGATRFAEDGQRFVLAFVPEGDVPPQPPATPSLAAPSDMG